MTLNITLADRAGPIAPLASAAWQVFHTLSFASLSGLWRYRIGFIAALVTILVVQYAKSPWRRVPPGPRGLPILGNALQLQDKRWMFGKDCKRKFGAF
jgi:hypothetical protein